MKKTKKTKPKRANGWRIFSRRFTTAGNPWLILNLELFNFGGGWSQLLAREQAEQLGR
jgi:hypothetical protein